MPAERIRVTDLWDIWKKINLTEIPGALAAIQEVVDLFKDPKPGNLDWWLALVSAFLKAADEAVDVTYTETVDAVVEFVRTKVYARIETIVQEVNGLITDITEFIKGIFDE